MRLIIKNFKENPAAFMRSRGYAFDKKTGDEFSFVRRISGREFPRFHAYVKTFIARDCFGPLRGPRNDRESAAPRNDRSGVIASEAKQSRQDLIINLHLDQKRPSYDTGPAHGGEYAGKLLDEEIKRIRK